MRTRAAEHFDVLVIGAGLSGIGAGCHLQRNCPERSYVLLEARERGIIPWRWIVDESRQRERVAA